MMQFPASWKTGTLDGIFYLSRFECKRPKRIQLLDSSATLHSVVLNREVDLEK